MKRLPHLQVVVFAGVLAVVAARGARAQQQPQQEPAAAPSQAEPAPAPAVPPAQDTAAAAQQPAAAAPEAPPTVKLPMAVNLDPSFDKKGVIEFSRTLLQQGALLPLTGNIEPDGPQEVADVLPLTLPNGDRAVLATIGFFGPNRGYMFVYRFHRDTVELVELTHGPEWGMSCENAKCREVAPESLKLLTTGDGRPVPLVRVTGWHQPGPQTWVSGVTNIYEVTNDGLRTVFTGAELFDNPEDGGARRKYRYSYRDVDSDGAKEIVADGEECEYHKSGPSAQAATATNCRKVKHVFKYDGTEFKRVSD